MPARLREASMHVYEGQSVVIPLAIEALPQMIESFGIRWLRKREFHMTAIAARVLAPIAQARPDTWERVTVVVSGRSIGEITPRREVRRVRDPEKPDLQTLIVMVDAPGLTDLYRALSEALEVTLAPPPAHVTVYSTDPAEGIGIVDAAELAERAPALSNAEHEEVLRAMSFDAVFT